MSPTPTLGGLAGTPTSDWASLARRALGASLLLLVSVGLTGCFETQKSREQAIAQGKTLFQLHCCGCHNGKRSDLAKLPPNLAGVFRQGHLPSGAPADDGQVRSTVLEGRSGIMPPFKDSLTEREINNIIRYLRSADPGTQPCAVR